MTSRRGSTRPTGRDGAVLSPGAEIRKRWVAGSAFTQIFLVIPAVQIVLSSGPAPAKVAAVVGMAVIGAAYTFVAPRAMYWPLQRRYLLVGALLVVSTALLPATGGSFTFVWIFVAILAGAMMPMRHTALVALVLAGGVVLGSEVDGGPANWELAIALVGLSCWMYAFMGNVRLTRALADTRRELADAAVVAERERIGRDLHDILGHSLTAIAVKAGLARRMIERGAGGAADEIADVERLAREALADVRATASGFREVSLGSELAVAATVLRAAGIQPVLPPAVDHVDPGAREIFGYVVREAVTNVVRHAGAARCTITAGPCWVEIRDDGAGAAAEPAGPAGSGLSGLAERLRGAGGALDAAPGAAGGFVVRAELPVGEPLPTVENLGGTGHPTVPAGQPTSGRGASGRSAVAG